MKRDNFCATVLLQENPFITIHNDHDEIFKFKMPTAKDIFDEPVAISLFRRIALDNINDIQREFFGKVITDTKLAFVLACIVHFEEQIGGILIEFFEKFIIDFKLTDDSSSYKQLTCNGNVIGVEEFDLLCKYVSIACGDRDIVSKEKEEKKVVEKSAEELEWERKKKENADKIKNARSKTDTHSFDNLIVSVRHEFGMSTNEIFNLTFYALMYYYSFVPKLMRYRVDVIAAGNGLLQKGHKYWIN